MGDENYPNALRRAVARLAESHNARKVRRMENARQRAAEGLGNPSTIQPGWDERERRGERR
jgi:hypothetical protein